MRYLQVEVLTFNFLWIRRFHARRFLWRCAICINIHNRFHHTYRHISVTGLRSNTSLLLFYCYWFTLICLGYHKATCLLHKLTFLFIIWSRFFSVLSNEIFRLLQFIRCLLSFPFLFKTYLFLLPGISIIFSILFFP